MLKKQHQNETNSRSRQELQNRQADAVIVSQLNEIIKRLAQLERA